MTGRSESYNRIFILGGKLLTSEELKCAFDKFGSITDVKMLKDQSGKNKGINYITYKKASEAALAIEKMNGQFICGLDKPIKVLLANDRNSGNVREPEEEDKMKRLFICVPESQNHEDLRNHFEKYGRVEYVKILPKNSRGVRLAFVKFETAYQAAVALENCEEVYKARFAETVWTSRRIRSENQMKRTGSQGMDAREPPRSKRIRGDDKDYADASHKRIRESRSRGGHSLFAKMASHLSPGQVFKLFDLQPGLESCDYNPQTGLVHASYLDYPFMERAKEKLKSFEYPPGHAIQFTETFGGVPHDNNNISMEQSFKVLLETIEKAAAVIQNSNLALNSGNNNNNSFASSSSHSDDSYKTNLLSSPRDILRPQHDILLDFPIAEQLHFTSSPDLIPVDVLNGYFCQFGNLVKVEYVPGGLSGIASFTCYESAAEASKSLDGQIINGNRLRILQNSNFVRLEDKRSSLRNSSH